MLKFLPMIAVLLFIFGFTGILKLTGFLLACIGLFVVWAFIYSNYFVKSDTKTDSSAILIYVDKNRNEYYLKEYYGAARTWEFAHVVKVNGNNFTDLAIRFDNFRGVSYSIYYGTSSADIGNGICIESGDIEDNIFAKIIWDEYIKPIYEEKWRKINEYERKLHENN